MRGSRGWCAVAMLAVGGCHTPQVEELEDGTVVTVVPDTPRAAPDTAPRATTRADVAELLADFDRVLADPPPFCPTGDGELLDSAVNNAVEAKSIMEAGSIDAAFELAELAFAQLVEADERERACKERRWRH